VNKTRKISSLLFVYTLAVILAGCGTKEMAPTPVRDVLLSGEPAPVGYGAYGYLVFTKRPSENDMERYAAVCLAYIRNLEPLSRYSPDVSPSLMPTYWLVAGEADFDERSPDCRMWVDSYDYPRAKVMASAVSALDSDGPLLVAWSKPFEIVAPGERALILDLSDFSNEDLDRAFGIWMDRITRDPAVWHAGFNLVLAKEAFRNFLEQYGDHIVKAISTVKEIVN
jgi:hypothetical protein